MKVCLMDMDDRTRQSMLLVMKHRTNDAVLPADMDVADVVIFDMDRDLEKSLDSFHGVQRRNPAIRAIGLSSKAESVADDILVLQKPISAGHLLNALQQATGRELKLPSNKTARVASALGSRITSNERRPDAVPASGANQQFNPHEYLFGIILDAEAQAKQKDKVAIISFYGDRFIRIDDKSETIETNLTPAQVRAFSISAVNGEQAEGSSVTIDLQRPSIELVSRKKAKEIFAGKIYRLQREAFMWMLGGMCSRGRLPMGARMDERLYLRRWPNMTRLSHVDNEMRIIAYWMRQPASLREIAEALDVSDQEVCSVYTAAYAAGLAGEARRESDGIWETPSVVESKERGIFSSLLKRLVQRKIDVTEEAIA